MFNTKYVMSKGLSFAEHEEMQMLSEYASKGWILCKFGFLGYKLKKAKSEQLQYSLDYRNSPDKEYFLYFEEAGWHHVCSIGNTLHIFSAPEGTKPIYTDSVTESEKYIIQYESIKKVAIPSLLCSILLIALVLIAKHNYIPDIYRIIFGIILMPTSIIAAISTVTCISYYFKINEATKVSTSNKRHKILNNLMVDMSILLIALFVLSIFNVISISRIIFYLICLIVILLAVSRCFVK